MTAPHDYSTHPPHRTRHVRTDAAAAVAAGRYLAGPDALEQTLEADLATLVRRVAMHVPATAVPPGTLAGGGLTWGDLLDLLARLGDAASTAFHDLDRERERFRDLHRDVLAARRLLGMPGGEQ